MEAIFMIQRGLLAFIRGYQKYISIRKNVKCPYIPSCSHYGYEAITKHGAFKGSILAIWRILRCNPFSKGGVDPVPDVFGKKR
jgi:putative membrane protein insertion efficiency factor